MHVCEARTPAFSNGGIIALRIDLLVQGCNFLIKTHDSESRGQEETATTE